MMRITHVLLFLFLSGCHSGAIVDHPADAAAPPLGGDSGRVLPDPPDDASTADSSSPPTTRPDGGAAPPIAMGTWTRVDTGGGPAHAYFYRSVVLDDGDIWMAWGQPSVSHEGNFIFRAASGRWERTNEVVDDPSKNIGRRENYGAWYDRDRHGVWISDGAPVAYGHPDGAQSGDLFYDIASDTFTLAYPNYGAGDRSIGRGDGAFLYDAGMLYVFGGFSIDPGQALTSRDLDTGVVSRHIAADTTPSFTQEPARLTYLRSGVDSRDGTLWTLADDGELYRIDPSAPSPAWEHVPTSGTKPGALAFGAALHEAANQLVAWVGWNGLVVADPGERLGETFVLDMGTREWRHGPRSSNGDPVPAISTLSVTVLHYDRRNERIVATVSMDSCQVWAYVPEP